jgi:hypothetical protein
MFCGRANSGRRATDPPTPTRWPRSRIEPRSCQADPPPATITPSGKAPEGVERPLRLDDACVGKTSQTFGSRLLVERASATASRQAPSTSRSSPRPRPAVMSMSSEAKTASETESSRKPLVDDISADEVEPITEQPGNAARTVATSWVEAVECGDEEPRLRCEPVPLGAALVDGDRDSVRRVDVIAVPDRHLQHRSPPSRA